MYCDPNGNFAIISFLIGVGISAAIGAVVGAVSYSASVVVAGCVTGNWDWSWGQFLGSVIGGAIGGAYSMIPGVGPMLGAFVTGFVSSAIGMGLQNAFGETNYSLSQILGTSLIIGGVSAITAGIMNRIKIPGLNKGRNSFDAISKSTRTKLWNGTMWKGNTIGHISMKTIGKIATVELYNSALGSLVSGLFSAFGLDQKIANYIDLFDFY